MANHFPWVQSPFSLLWITILGDSNQPHQVLPSEANLSDPEGSRFQVLTNVGGIDGQYEPVANHFSRFKTYLVLLIDDVNISEAKKPLIFIEAINIYIYI